MRLVVICLVILILSSIGVVYIFNAFYGHGIKSPSEEREPSHSSSSSSPPSPGQAEDGEILNQRLMGLIHRMIDKDADSFLSEAEVKKWLVNLQEEIVVDQVRMQWTFYAQNSTAIESDAFLSEYKRDPLLYKKHGRRFEFADKDNSSALTLGEFRDYLYPDDQTLLEEVIDVMDSNSNGHISASEFRRYLNSTELKRPAGVTADLDGYISSGRVQEWLFPTVEDLLNEWVKDLFSCDKDKDRRLSRPEVADNYPFFVPLLPLNFDKLDLTGESLSPHVIKPASPLGKVISTEHSSRSPQSSDACSNSFVVYLKEKMHDQ